jgi:hypothetical protein
LARSGRCWFRTHLGTEARPRRRCKITSLSGKTLFISGGSRGIGKAIALRAARDGANLVIAAKTDAPHPKLEGTIYLRRGGDRGRRGLNAPRRLRHPL